MYPGSRPIPFDYPSCRNSVKFILLNQTFNFDIYYFNKSYLTCRWYGMQHFWHTLFDYTVPLYWTTKLFGGPNKEDLIFFLDNNNNSLKGTLFLNSFSNYPFLSLKYHLRNKSICWNHSIIGFPKTEFIVTPSKWNSVLNIPYEFPYYSFEGFRDHMITNYLNSSTLEYCNPNKINPKILILYRTSTKRNIMNKVELEENIQKWCPNCIITTSYSENETLSEQISLACNSSILISIHGGGLSHMIWMKPNQTSVIEILPYKYNCRNWYHQIANSSRIHYFSWINENLSNTFQGRFDKKEYESCLDEEYPCLSNECHDSLRDQLTVIDVESFRVIFFKALEILK